MDYALELNNVTKIYEDFKLDNIAIKLPKGCIMGFVGENGAGKSTTIKLILDLIKRDTGSIKVLGKENKSDSKDFREKIGVVMDECCFPENLNINGIHLVFKSIYKTWNQKKFYELVKRFELPDKKEIKDFSKGMKMKLSIAGALSHDSEILILDEATSGLDPIIRDEILDVFLEFIQDEKKSIFMSSHIISDLEKACDYICFIHKGKILFTESKDDLLDRYGVLKCTLEDFKNLDKKSVVGYRKNSFGVEGLVFKQNIKDRRYIIDSVKIEDIMLFYIKGDRV